MLGFHVYSREPAEISWKPVCYIYYIEGYNGITRFQKTLPRLSCTLGIFVWGLGFTIAWGGQGGPADPRQAELSRARRIPRGGPADPFYAIGNGIELCDVLCTVHIIPVILCTSHRNLQHFAAACIENDECLCN